MIKLIMTAENSSDFDSANNRDPFRNDPSIVIDYSIYYSIYYSIDYSIYYGIDYSIDYSIDYRYFIVGSL